MTGPGGRKCLSGRLVFGGLFGVVDDQDFDGVFARFQFEAEVSLEDGVDGVGGF